MVIIRFLREEEYQEIEEGVKVNEDVNQDRHTTPRRIIFKIAKTIGLDAKDKIKEIIIFIWEMKKTK